VGQNTESGFKPFKRGIFRGLRSISTRHASASSWLCTQLRRRFLIHLVLPAPCTELAFGNSEGYAAFTTVARGSRLPSRHQLRANHQRVLTGKSTEDLSMVRTKRLFTSPGARQSLAKVQYSWLKPNADGVRIVALRLRGRWGVRPQGCGERESVTMRRWQTVRQD
jgi:hypothetical protein